MFCVLRSPIYFTIYTAHIRSICTDHALLRCTPPRHTTLYIHHLPFIMISPEIPTPTNALPSNSRCLARITPSYTTTCATIYTSRSFHDPSAAALTLTPSQQTTSSPSTTSAQSAPKPWHREPGRSTVHHLRVASSVTCCVYFLPLMSGPCGSWTRTLHTNAWLFRRRPSKF
jgi:hypothetical protein